jgi:hypothetical protein
MSDKLVRWLHKRRKRLKKQGRTTQGNRRQKVLWMMDWDATTIKVWPIDGKYCDTWVSAEEAAKDINRLAALGRPFKAHEHYPSNIWGDKPTPEFVGYYVRAEVTDIGELWVRYYATNDPAIGVIVKEPPYWLVKKQEEMKNRNYLFFGKLKFWCPYVPLT